MTLSRREFLKYLEDGKVETTMKTPGKVDWDMIYAELKKTKAPLTIATIQEHYVQNKVVRRRTKNVLNAWYQKGKCLRIVYKGRYLYLFQIPKDYQPPKE